MHVYKNHVSFHHLRNNVCPWDSVFPSHLTSCSFSLSVFQKINHKNTKIKIKKNSETKNSKMKYKIQNKILWGLFRVDQLLLVWGLSWSVIDIPVTLYWEKNDFFSLSWYQLRIGSWLRGGNPYPFPPLSAGTPSALNLYRSIFIDLVSNLHLFHYRLLSILVVYLVTNALSHIRKRKRSNQTLYFKA